MTDATDDPFERAIDREHELRAQDEADEEIVRQSTLASVQGAVVFAFLLPVHLLATDWTRTASVNVHLVLLLLCAMGAVTHWIDGIRHVRAPVYHLGRANVVVSGLWKKKQRW